MATATELSRDVFTEAVAAGVRAPSLHNSQPWLFRLRGGGVDVIPDLTRRLPVADPTGWAVRVACGAAAFNVRRALAVRGYGPQTTPLPAAYDRGVLARVAPGTPRPPTPEESALYAAIPRRQSNRYPFRNEQVSREEADELMRAARAEACWLELLADRDGRDLVAELAREADRRLQSDPAYQEELASGVRPEAPDGVRPLAGGPALEPDEQIPRRDYQGRQRSGPRDFESASLLAVLTSPGDGLADQVGAGIALQRVLLTATDLGLASSLISQPIEVPDIRARLRAHLGGRRVPQIVLRFGYGTPVPRTHRRPISEVVID